MEIVKKILEADPETSPNTISGSIWDLEKTCPSGRSLSQAVDYTCRSPHKMALI